MDLAKNAPIQHIDSILKAIGSIQTSAKRMRISLQAYSVVLTVLYPGTTSLCLKKRLRSRLRYDAGEDIANLLAEYR